MIGESRMQSLLQRDELFGQEAANGIADRLIARPLGPSTAGRRDRSRMGSSPEQKMQQGGRRALVSLHFTTKRCHQPRFRQRLSFYQLYLPLTTTPTFGTILRTHGLLP